jgi:hypothetical protein
MSYYQQFTSYQQMCRLLFQFQFDALCNLSGELYASMADPEVEDKMQP